MSSEGPPRDPAMIVLNELSVRFGALLNRHQPARGPAAGARFSVSSGVA